MNPVRRPRACGTSRPRRTAALPALVLATVAVTGACQVSTGTADGMRTAELRGAGTPRTVVGRIAERNDRIEALCRACPDQDKHP